MNYNLDYFIKKFEAIPERLWITGVYGSDYQEEHCAYGHCGVRALRDTLEGDALRMLTGGLTVSVNDGASDKYPQCTPKERILAYLRDLRDRKSAQEVKIEPKLQVKEIIKYVAVDTKVRQEAQEAVLELLN